MTSSFHQQQGIAAIESPFMAKESAAAGPAAAMAPTMTTGTNPNFPVKLHCCLTELERQGLAHIASFQPHGRCIIVRKIDEFVKDVLPRWFNQTKYSSFQRQLNLYGFQRITSGVDKGGYYHPKFLRGKQYLTYGIPRVPLKGTECSMATSIEAVPNFYKMPHLLDTPTSSSAELAAADDDTPLDEKTAANSQTLPGDSALVDRTEERNQQAELLALLQPVLPSSTIHVPSFSGPVLPGAVSASPLQALFEARANQLSLTTVCDDNQVSTIHTNGTPSLLARLELERRIQEQIGQQQHQQLLAASLNMSTISSLDTSLSALRQELAVQRLLGYVNQQGMGMPTTSAISSYETSPVASLQLSELMGAATAAAATPSLATNLAPSPETQLRAALLTDALRHFAM